MLKIWKDSSLNLNIPNKNRLMIIEILDIKLFLYIKTLNQIFNRNQKVFLKL